MDTFIIKNKFLIAILAILCISMYTLGESLLYKTRNNIRNINELKKEISIMMSFINKEAEIKAEAIKNGIENFSDVASFMRKINKIASECQVIINKMTPDVNDERVFNLEMILDYNSFLRFASNLELLNVVVSKMEVHRYDTVSIPPKHSITFTIQPRQNAQPLTGGRFTELQKAVSDSKGFRNPFQRFAYDPNTIKQEEKIDLTWIYILSGIGEGKDGKRNATINYQTYYIGDVVDNKKIVGIEGQSVFLEEQNGYIKYVLKFRNKDKTGRNDR